MPKLHKERILEDDKRRKIYSAIRSNPGIHLRELQRRLDIPLSTLNYHVNYLRRKKIIHSEKHRNSFGFYVEPISKEDKRFLSVFRRRRFRDIIYAVLANENVDTKFLGEELDIPTSTLYFYLNHLVKNGVLEKNKMGYQNFYTIADVKKVARVFITYKSSLLDRLVDETLGMLLETSFGK